MKPIATDDAAREAMEARRAQLDKVRKAELARMHVDNGGLMGLQTYLGWHKDELVNAVLEDEGHRWHPAAEAAE